MTQYSSKEEKIREIRERVVGMYTKHPWPSTRQADEEMGWRLKMLGIVPQDYQDKRVLEMGCGTGEYALWYAVQGAREVVGIDLSQGSLALARQKKEEGQVHNITFMEMDVLKPTFPDNSFDYVYSVGVLHHTGDPETGFREMCRMVKPGGVIVISLYNSYSRFLLRIKQNLCKVLGGEDLDRRAKIGRTLFPLTMRQMNKRYHETNYELISYDIFGFPHESVHTGGEVLKWFDRYHIRYTGSFAPLRLRDYFYAFSLPEYHEFKKTFVGFPHVRLAGKIMNKLSSSMHQEGSDEAGRTFPRPSPTSQVLTQLLWFLIGNRINCFTLAGRKQA